MKNVLFTTLGIVVALTIVHGLSWKAQKESFMNDMHDMVEEMYAKETQEVEETEEMTTEEFDVVSYVDEKIEEAILEDYSEHLMIDDVLFGHVRINDEWFDYASIIDGDTMKYNFVYTNTNDDYEKFSEWVVNAHSALHEWADNN